MPEKNRNKPEAKKGIHKSRLLPTLFTIIAGSVILASCAAAQIPNSNSKESVKQAWSTYLATGDHCQIGDFTDSNGVVTQNCVISGSSTFTNRNIIRSIDKGNGTGGEVTNNFILGVTPNGQDAKVTSCDLGPICINEDRSQPAPAGFLEVVESKEQMAVVACDYLVDRVDLFDLGKDNANAFMDATTLYMTFAADPDKQKFSNFGQIEYYPPSTTDKLGCGTRINFKNHKCKCNFTFTRCKDSL